MLLLGIMLINNNRIALQLEGKPIPPKLKHFIDPSIRPPAYNPDSLGFVIPNAIVSSNVIAAIPFEQIGRVVGFGFSVYSYSKVVIIAYRYGQQFLSKYKLNRRIQLFREQRSFLIFILKFKIQRTLYKMRRKPQQHLLFSGS